MQKLVHKVTHHLQPTNSTCGYTALAILLSFYGKDYSPEELVDKVPQPLDPEGVPVGSITAQLADWCQTHGIQTHMYVSDLFIFDLSWKDKTPLQIKKRLGEVKSKRSIPIMPSYWVGVYEDAYLTMLADGADLTIVPFITTGLLNDLLADGPVYANICSTANSGRGRTIATELRKSVVDDIHGGVRNHSVVIYGRDEGGNYLVADPWYGRTVIGPEQMVLAIQAAQIECDNLVFVIKDKSD